MKKFLLMFLGMLMAQPVLADKLPVIYSTNFDNEGVIDQWTQYGLGRELIDNAETKSIWGTPTSKPYVLITTNSESWNWASSTSNFVDISTSNPADEWLVSPSFRMPYDNAIVSYRAYSTNVSSIPLYNNQFVVKVTDKGNTQSDFPDTNISEGELRNNAGMFTGIINGYKDKDINLAFINVSTAPGILGFNHIDVMQYYIYAENNTPEFSKGETKVVYGIQLQTPVACKGFKAILTSSTGVEDIYENDTELSEDIQTFYVKFDNPIDITDETSKVNYSVSIIPNFDGAVETEITGEITNSSLSGIDEVNVDFIGRDIFNAQGICVKRNATENDIKALSPGIYIIGGRKVIIK